MDLIPGYSNYLDPGYQFPGEPGGDSVGDTRQRSLSGDRVVILPRRGGGGDAGDQVPHPPVTVPSDYHPAADRVRGPGGAPEWRVPPVPPHYGPDSVYPGECPLKEWAAAAIWCRLLLNGAIPRSQHTSALPVFTFNIHVYGKLGACRYSDYLNHMSKFMKKTIMSFLNECLN